jgi:hypothetical protein
MEAAGQSKTIVQMEPGYTVPNQVPLQKGQTLL